MQSMTSHNDKRHPVSASDFRLLTESQKYGLYAECFRSAGLRGEQASYRIGYVDGATGKPPQVELTGPEKALCTPSHGALVPNCIALDGCQYPHICKHRNECFWIKGTDATDRGVKP
jgi:hypothetical protein